MSRLRAALSLYVAIAVHLLLILGLAFKVDSPLPAGAGNGLGEGDASDAESLVEPGTGESRERVAEGRSDRPGVLTLAAAPVEIRNPVAVPEAPAENAALVTSSRSRATASAGPGGGGRGGYLSQVRQHLSRNRHALPGVTADASSEVAFTIGPEGAVSNLRLVKASSVAALDAEALAVVRRAAPFPAPPDGKARSLRVPVSMDVSP